MTGKQLQEIIKGKRLYQWEIAQELGINEFTLSRWLRGTLTKEREKAILEAIKKLSQKD